jgi:ABC-2 type transport system ATP-binding protein
MTGRRAVAVSLRGVVKRFGSLTALAGVDLDVREGEALTLLGPNGAGKTTAIRIMLGLRRPDAGTALLFGSDPRDPPSRAGTGVTPQDLDLPGTLRVTEILDFARRHFADPTPVTELLERFQLEQLARRQVGGLSGGEQRRVAVALAFAGKPRAVFLDEPTTGLDVESRRAVWSAIRQFGEQGGTVLLTTHSLEEAESLATRVAIMHAGRIVRQGTVSTLTSQLGVPSLESAFLALTSGAR